MIIGLVGLVVGLGLGAFAGARLVNERWNNAIKVVANKWAARKRGSVLDDYTYGAACQALLDVGDVLVRK